MDREYWEEKLQAFIDNELGPADRLAVEQKLETDPDFRANLKYLRSMKKRLQAHAASIEIPKSVEQRLNSLFERKQRVRRLKWVFGPALALAAALALAILAPRLMQDSYHFVDRVTNGVVICHGCEVAHKAGLEKGELCRQGHQLGLKTEDGKLWRFAPDNEGLKFIDDLTLIGKDMRVYGQALSPERLIRIKTMDPQEPSQQAHANGGGASHRDHRRSAR